MPKAKIVSLSACHSLKPIIPTGIGVQSGIGAFARLCDKYSRGGWCPRMFAPLPNLIWVGYVYNRDLNTWINPYKLGLIDTKQFMERMLETFDFLNEETTHFTDEDWGRIEANKDNFVSTKDVQNLSRKDIALALLEEAWNEIIEFSEQDIGKFNYLLEEDPDTRIYLISDTNELNVYKILRTLRKEIPNIAWEQEVNLKHDVSGEGGLIKVAPNIFLSLSYKYHTFKTTLPQAGPSLFSRLVKEEFKGDVSNIEVISEHDTDLEEARSLGFNEENLIPEPDYFFVERPQYNTR